MVANEETALVFASVTDQAGNVLNPDIMFFWCDHSGLPEVGD